MSIYKEVAHALGVSLNEHFFIKNTEIGAEYYFTEDGLYYVNYTTSSGKSIGERVNADILQGLISGAFKITGFVPKDGERYYYIQNMDGDVASFKFDINNPDDLANYKLGNCFPNKEKTEAMWEKLKVDFKAIQADVLNGKEVEYE